MKRGNQSKLARKIKKSDAFICQILSGKRRPSWTVAKELAAATRTKPELWLDASPDKLKSVLAAVNF